MAPEPSLPEAGPHDAGHPAHPHRLRHSRVAKRARLFRARLNHRPRARLAYKVGIGIVGALVVIIGIILIPLPGPGSLVILLGIAILGTEFPAAHRVNMWVQGKIRWALALVKRWRDRRRARKAATARS